MRTRELARREYEGVWSDIASQIELQITAGETDAVRIIERAWNWRSAGFLDSSGFRHYYEHLGVPNDPEGKPTQRLTVRDGAYRLIPFATPATTGSCACWQTTYLPKPSPTTAWSSSAVVPDAT